MFGEGDRVRFSSVSRSIGNLRAHDGMEAVVLFELEESLVDTEEVGRMYCVRFDDGFEPDVFEEELEAVGDEIA